MGKRTTDSDESLLRDFLNKKLDRRTFLRISEKLAGVGLLSSVPFLSTAKNTPGKRSAPYISHSPKFRDYPFKLGVASGDPLPDGVVIWTRLAPDPLSHNGGMPHTPVEVQWEVADDNRFTKIRRKGVATADPGSVHSVHVEVDGLEPNRWYYYRFKAGSEMSPLGRTKTTPAFTDQVDNLSFVFASCQNYTQGYFTAYEHMVNEDIDAVLFLGDYIYEYGGEGEIGRGHIPQKETFSLDDYRIRHAQYKTDPALQAAHAAFPWIVTLDDHEIKNDWGGEGPPYEDNAQFLARRAAALRAYYEHMPLRKSAVPDDISMQLYRRFKFGNLVEFNVLDTRQYRTDFACGGRLETQCSERFDNSRTMLGEKQEKWLFEGLKSSSTHWNVLAQQVMMAQRDRKKGAAVGLHMDKWDGYAASRERLFDVIEQNNLRNVVVLTGDQHSNWVNDLKKDFNDLNSATLATEFVGTSITSGGNGADMEKKGQIALDENPHINFYNAQRGYVLCNVTPEKWRTDFKVMPYVNNPNAPINIRASFEMKNGESKAVQI